MENSAGNSARWCAVVDAAERQDVMAIDPVSIGAAAITLITGLFKSRKHYMLFYFEEVDDSWKFVMDGIPSQVNPVAKSYTVQGIQVAIVRNKDAKHTAAELMPKEPPKGYTPNTPAATNYLTIAAVAAGIGLILYFLFFRKGKR